MSVDPRFLKEEGWEVFTGNELIVKGLLEAEGGTHLWTGYPGSPVAGFFDCIESLQDMIKPRGIKAFIANNEALSAAAINGAQMAGLRAITAMKSVGVHVASDALAIGNLAGAHPDGGAVVVLGDDPWNDSTQTPADSRYICKHMHMPVLEASTSQELKDWVDIAFKLSREAELYIGYLVTTNQADGGGSVITRKNNFPHVNTLHKTELDSSTFDLEKTVLLPPRTSRREEDFPNRYRRLWASAERLQVDRIEYARSKAPLGFITSALAYSYLKHALHELGVLGQFPILKLGITYPINPKMLEQFSDITSEWVVVEERRGFIEEQIAQFLSQRQMPVRLYGKTFPGNLEGLPESRGLNPSILIEKLSPWIRRLMLEGMLEGHVEHLEAVTQRVKETGQFSANLPSRTPTFCPGCPHRDSSSVLMEVKRQFRDPEYMRKHHRREAVDLVFHGDTGCYTMLMFEPTKDLMHNYSGMGLGGGTGMGVDPFITNKQVVFMGDGTFFHSGQIAISNSIKNGQDITYIILDNKTTAMTGHQQTPGIEADIMGNTTFVQSIDKIVEAMIHAGDIEVIRTNPAAREQYRQTLETTILKNGVKVIIADKECGITFHRRLQREERKVVAEKGFLPLKRHINIAADACEHCLECTKSTGCPGLTFTETDFGRKLNTDLTWCVSDTACVKINACPAFEEVILVREQKPENRLADLDLDNIPQPKPLEWKDSWSIYLAGVGGMGIATSTATLVRAAHRHGLHVAFCDKNGLAIRNGGVYSQLSLYRERSTPLSQLISYGNADVILGLDPLEAARGLDASTTLRVGHPARTHALVNAHKTPTIKELLGREDFCLSETENFMRQHTRSYVGVDLASAAEKYFQSKIYVNIMMLGVAYQSGLLPMSLESMEWGIRETMGKAFANNWKAFNLGRRLYLDAVQNKVVQTTANAQTVISEKSEYLLKLGRQGKRLAQQYWQLTARAIELLPHDEEFHAVVVKRLYELIRYDNPAYAERYLQTVLDVMQYDTPARNFALTKAVAWNLHKVMAIKDEVYVAYQLTSEEKYQRDREKYGIHPELGDRIIYKHFNQPEFVWGPIKIRFKMKTRDWMLRLMAKGKILRKLLPQWHAKEKNFREWYFETLIQALPQATEHYDQVLEITRLPEDVTGYREVRYPKMQRARQLGEQKLAQLRQPETVSQAK